MAIKDIMTIVDSTGKRPAAKLAAELARNLDAHLTGLSIAYAPMMPASGIVPASEELISGAREAWLELARAADADFREMGRLAGIRYESRIIDAPSDGYFREIAHAGRLTDLVVVGQDNPDELEPMRSALIETLLMESGAPTLLIPYIGAGDFVSGRALVAWDGGMSAARAVRAALPLLALCSSVTVLTIGDRAGGISDIAVYLDRHGLKTEVSRVPGGSVPVADVVLNTAMDGSYDWVVMGAYGHSRLREHLFGGATRDILSEMTVPVVMAH